MSDKKRKFILSDSNSINSKGFRVDVNGIDLRRFTANPVMFYEHDPERVIGKWDAIEKAGGKLIALPVFDKDDDEALSIAGKVERGFINGASVGLIVKDMEEIDGVDVVTHSELIEASIVSVPADAGAVQLYNEKMECLSIDSIKLNMNKKKRLNDEGKTDFKALYSEICEALGLTPDTEIDEVLQTIDKLMQPKVENEIKEALRLGIISKTERPYYEQLSRKGNADVIDLLSLRKREYEKTENRKIGELFRLHNEKICTYLGVDGWEDIRKLGYDSAKRIVDCLPERMRLSQMTVQKGSNDVCDLDWYRKNDPKALENDPELFKRLSREKRQAKKYLN